MTVLGAVNLLAQVISYESQFCAWKGLGFSKQNLTAREAPISSVAKATGLPQCEMPYPVLSAFVCRAGKSRERPSPDHLEGFSVDLLSFSRLRGHPCTQIQCPDRCSCAFMALPKFKKW